MKLKAPGYWQSRGIIALLLYPLSLVFRLLVWLRRQSFNRGLKKSTTASVPVIVIGNLSVGGAGKTPLVIALVEQLVQRGRRPGIVSRGYGGSAASATLVDSASDHRQVGDEALMLARRTTVPVAVCASRAAAVDLLTKSDCDVVVSDDGLQHYALNRQLEICVIDAHTGLGNGWCLPAGPLREPPSRLRDVDIIVYSGSSQDVAPHSAVRRKVSDYLKRSPDIRDAATVEGAYTLRVDTVVNLGDTSCQRSLAEFSAVSVNAVAAIGRPEKFFSQLKCQGISIREHAFSDHHVFKPIDLEFNDGLDVLMTEKDSVKCAAFARQHHWYVKVTAELDGGIVDAVMDRLSGD